MDIVSQITPAIADLRDKATSLWQNYQSMEVRDQLTVVAIALAATSLVIAWLAHRRSRRDARHAVRKQLSDTVQKLLDLNTETARLELAPDQQPRNSGGLIGDQRRFHARQAQSLFRHLGKDVSTWEYLLVGRAFADLTEPAVAEAMFKRAIRGGKSRIEDATALRGYARFLFQVGEHERARKTIRKAVARLGERARTAFEVGFTYESWAGFEWQFGDQAAAGPLLDTAAEYYARDPWHARKAKRIAALADLPYRGKPAPAAEPA